MFINAIKGRKYSSDILKNSFIVKKEKTTLRHCSPIFNNLDSSSKHFGFAINKFLP